MSDDPTTPGPAVPPPPGWYQDPQTGRPRWWDGGAWGPPSAAPPAAGAGNGTAMAVLSHLGIFLFGIVVPLIIYLTAGKDDPDVRHHAREALNFQITFVILWFGMFFTLFIGSFASIARSSDAPPPAFFVLFFGMFGMYALAIGLSIFGAVQAGRGRRWRYPVSLRLVGRHDADARA